MICLSRAYVLVAQEPADLELAEGPLGEDFVFEGLLDLLDRHVRVVAVVHRRDDDAVRTLSDSVDDFVVLVDLEASLEPLDVLGLLLVAERLVEVDYRLGHFPFLLLHLVECFYRET